MVVRIPGPVVVLDGLDCARLNEPLAQLVVALRRRDGHVPAELVRIVEEVRRAAIEFRTNSLSAHWSEAASGTSDDESGSVTRVSDASDEWLSAHEAARLTQVSPEFIRRLAVEGVLKGMKTGPRGAWRITALSVAVWNAGRNHDKAA